MWKMAFINIKMPIFKKKHRPEYCKKPLWSVIWGLRKLLCACLFGRDANAESLKQINFNPSSKLLNYNEYIN